MLGWKSPLLYMQGMIHYYILNVAVAPREGRVSRNRQRLQDRGRFCQRRAPRGACE